jgi:hypothetical protein
LWTDIKYAKWALWREWKGGVFVIHRHLAGKPTAEVIAEVPGDQFSWLDASPAFEKATYTVAARRTAVKTLTGAPSLKIGGSKF